jgi:septal ring factor EnvC (AmiA/AmiB activator)
LHSEVAHVEKHRESTNRSIEKLVAERTQQEKDIAVMQKDLATVERLIGTINLSASRPHF